jgi:hypothetical protein
MNIKISLGSLPVIITVVFLILKLCGVIAWSWLWVFAPLWMPAAIFLGLMLVVFLVTVLAGLITGDYWDKAK